MGPWCGNCRLRKNLRFLAHSQNRSRYPLKVELNRVGTSPIDPLAGRRLEFQEASTRLPEPSSLHL
jgi:hypothetical protein